MKTDILLGRGFQSVACFGLWLALFSPIWLRADDANQVACPACKGTAVCAAKDCKEGKVLCPGKCLKKETPGWKKAKVPGFSDENMLWMEFRYTEGGKSQGAVWSQNHLGEIIEYENGKPVNKGRCPQCQGSTRVDCSACAGDAKCEVCAGAGKFVRGETLFSLKDSQGRALEAVVKSRKADSVTILRLADQRVFDLPLSALAPESVAEIEAKFPAP